MVIKIDCKLKVYESRYKHRAKIYTEKLFVLSFNSLLTQFNFILFNPYRNSRKITIQKFSCNFTKTEFFCMYSCIIPIIPEYLQNVAFFYLLIRFYNNFRILRSLNSLELLYFRNQVVIIANETRYRKLTFYLRNFMALISFLFYLCKAFFVCVTFTPSEKFQ